MSHRSENRKLYDQLKSQLDQDKLYWLRNDAKIRAVTTSKSYDEFRDIVAAAHLKPIAKSDKQKQMGD